MHRGVGFEMVEMRKHRTAVDGDTIAALCGLSSMEEFRIPNPKTRDRYLQPVPRKQEVSYMQVDTFKTRYIHTKTGCGLVNAAIALRHCENDAEVAIVWLKLKGQAFNRGKDFDYVAAARRIVESRK